MKIEKVYPAGWKMVTPNEIYYFGEYGQFGCYCNDGVVYKDDKAFETGNGVCYIPEFGFENADKNPFEFDAKERIATEIEDNPYVAIQGYTRQDFIELCDGNVGLAKELYESVDWQHPETLWDEWLEDEELQEMIKEGK